MIVRESINFQRGIDPKHAMGIGHSGIMKAFIKTMNDSNEDYNEWQKEWLDVQGHDVHVLLGYNGNNIKDIIGFDEDSYIDDAQQNGEEIDYDEFQNEWIQDYGQDKIQGLNSSWYIGQVDGYQVIRYLDGMGSGYVMNRNWLKSNI